MPHDAAGPRATGPGPDDDARLPEQTADDRDVGWGEAVVDDDPDDLRRFLDDVPPHHGG